MMIFHLKRLSLYLLLLSHAGILDHDEIRTISDVRVSFEPVYIFSPILRESRLDPVREIRIVPVLVNGREDLSRRRIGFLAVAAPIVIVSSGYESFIFIVFHRRERDGRGSKRDEEDEFIVTVSGSLTIYFTRSSGSSGSFCIFSVLYTTSLFHTFHTMRDLSSGSIS